MNGYISSIFPFEQILKAKRKGDGERCEDAWEIRPLDS